MKVEIYAHWGDGRPIGRQPARAVEVLRFDDETVIVHDEFAEDWESIWRRSDGRRLEPDGTPSSWDFYRLRVIDVDGGHR